jgi:hypothetical protein
VGALMNCLKDISLKKKKLMAKILLRRSKEKIFPKKCMSISEKSTQGNLIKKIGKV